MRTKSVKNYKLHVGDIAIDRISKNGVDYIIAASLENPDLRIMVTYTGLKLVSTNMNDQQIGYALGEIRNNKEFL